MDEYKIKRLEELSKEAKRKIIKISAKAKAPHVGSCLSVIDILISIYFDIFDNELSPEKFKSKEAPAIILSKGHASAALYTVLFLKGYISEEQLFTYHEDNGLPGHVTTSVNGVYFSTGSLGHGLAVGCGMALANKLDKKNKNVIVIMSDGEIEEGSVWEAANFAAIKKLNNLIGVIDNNGLQGYSKFSDVFYGSIDEKFRAFGWEVLTCNGHDFRSLRKTFNEVLFSSSTKPKVIIAKTIKGKGLKNLENTIASHYIPPSEDDFGE